MQPILLYTTVKNKQEALAIAEALLAEKLVACANILPPHTAVYHWQGAMQQEEEVLMLLKTSTAVESRVMARIAQLHSYNCPCILALPVEAAEPAFAQWIFSQIGD